MKRRRFMKSVAGAVTGSALIGETEEVETTPMLVEEPGPPHIETRPIDTEVVGSATPIVFDPEILEIMRMQAPVLDVIPTVAKDGFETNMSERQMRELVERATA